MKIGFVCGFFDILHEGRIQLLRYAKEHCDYLIVAVGTDEFMIERKNHPAILSYAQRKAVVSAIQYVDKVVPETDLDRVASYHLYHFDILFAGDDHINEKTYIDAEKELNKLGVEIVYIPRINNMSSTVIRERVRNGNF